MNKTGANHSEVGKFWENLAFDYLLKKGFRPIARNIRYPFGEIDLLMKEKDTLVFVEVRFRNSSIYGSALETVSKAKQKKLIKAAQAYLVSIKGELPWCRFDVVAITGSTAKYQLEHIVDAFVDEGF